MDFSIFIAKIAGIGYLAVGIGFLRGQISVKKMIDSFEKSPGLTLITGLFSVIIGAILVSNHNIWVWHWTVLVTIIGWGALIKGAMYLAFPDVMNAFVPMFKNTKGIGFFVIAIGLVFAYFGFVA